MFGTLRTILALMVLIGHLTDQWQIGTYAVFAFYIISGYLMTTLMQQSYGYRPAGVRDFMLNRFLRLYPSYWAVIVLTLVAITTIGADFASAYNKLMVIPGSASEWLSVIGMVYIGWFPNQVSPNLAPTTWAITVELFFYVCIALGLSKTRLRVYCWLFASVAYVLYCQVLQLDWPHKYFPIPAASLPFAIGAYIYFLRQDSQSPLSDGWMTAPWFLLLLLLANAATTLYVPIYFQTGFYVSLLLSIILCFELAMGRRWPGWISKGFDKAIGDYSYPIYLMHWQVGMVVAYLLYGTAFQSRSTQGWIVTGLTALACFAIAWLLLACIDKPVQRIRGRIKAARQSALARATDTAL